MAQEGDGPVLEGTVEIWTFLGIFHWGHVQDLPETRLSSVKFHVMIVSMLPDSV